mmetsp:Transcript_44037/g.71690  ORF Transcript_44037/g.71690 Transcript_44037/m.71690 type:complete len:677 (+) Transcript_44037:241-2271(+)
MAAPATISSFPTKVIDVSPLSDGKVIVVDGDKPGVPLQKSKGDLWKEKHLRGPVSRLLWDFRYTFIATTIYVLITATCAWTVWKDQFTWKSHIMIAILYFLMYALVNDYSAGISFLGALTFSLAFDIITPSEALAGFSNAGVFQVGVLFIVAGGVAETGVLDYSLRRILGRPSKTAIALARLCIPVACISTFLNNTPIVAMGIPIVAAYAQRTGIPPSKLMIPLSYATILGGSISYIGTSINLIAFNLAKAQEPTFSMNNLFEIGSIGGPTAVAGLLYIIFWLSWFLPIRQANTGIRPTREFSTHIQVNKSLANKSVGAAGLWSYLDIELLEIQRGPKLIAPVTADTVLQDEDIILASGPSYDLLDILRVRGLESTERAYSAALPRSEKKNVVEVVIGVNSPLVGRSTRALAFYATFNAVPLAIHRVGVRLSGAIENIPLQSGDALLLIANVGFTKRFRNDQTFALVSVAEPGDPTDRPSVLKMAWAGACVLAMIVIPSIEPAYITLTHTVLLAAFAMIATGCIDAARVYEVIDADVLLTVACAFGVGTALDKSKLAQALADSITSIFSSGGKISILFGVYIGSVILNALVTNAACVALVFPIVYKALKGVVALKTIVYILMMAGSADFSTPIGYQTNLMVQKPGGYTFLDYTKAGLPLQIIVMLVSVPLAFYYYN